MKVLSFLSILGIYASFILFCSTACSSSEDDDEQSSHHGYSSDDEESLCDNEVLKRAWDKVKTGEKSYPWEVDPAKARQITGNNGARPLSCIDGNGQEVDWWFVYKEPGGLRYLYYSSLEVDTRSSFFPLNPNFLINDPATSPVLKTIYHPNNLQSSSEVWLGWNDQPDADEEEKKKGKVDSFDAYGNRVCGVKHAHSKGFYAQNAVLNPNYGDKNVVTIGSYAIMTSLPRFPKIDTQSPATFGSALRSALPTNPQNIFDSNLSAKAQHFFCMSMPREEVELVKNNNTWEVPVDFSAPHVKFLHKYLKTIHPAIMGTNFSDHRVDLHWWRRYFSLFKMPAVDAMNYLKYSETNIQVQAYSIDNLPSLSGEYRFEANQHVFPLTTCQYFIAADKGIYHSSVLISRWDSQYSSQNGCVYGSENQCLASFTFETTRLQSSLKINLFAKHGAAVLDLWDDWATLQAFESQKASLEHSLKGQVIDRYGLLVQSWIDSKTALPRKSDKKIFNEDGHLEATFHIDNISHYEMPAVAYSYNYYHGCHILSEAAPVKVDSKGKDHSKWGIAFALDTFDGDGEDDLKEQNYSFIPTVFVSDLNRSNTQACLKDKNRGRGGGAVAILSANLWRALLKLHPRTPKQKFATTGKHRTRILQNRLRRHTNLENNYSALPLDPLRSSIFRSLRLSKKEASKPKKAASFVPVLNEIKKFIKIAEFKPEHAASDAFKRLFESFSEGQVEGSAERVWRKTLRKIAKIENDPDVDEVDKKSTLLEFPKFISIPSINLYREIPDDSREDDNFLRKIELERQTPYIVTDKEELKTVDPIDSFIIKMRKIPKFASTQTDTVPSNTDLHKKTTMKVKSESLETEYITRKVAMKVKPVDDISKLISGLSSTHLDSANKVNAGNTEETDNSEEDNENSEDDADSDQDNDTNSSDKNDTNSSDKNSTSNSDNESESDHDTEYYDHMKRIWRQNDGDDSSEN